MRFRTLHIHKTVKLACLLLALTIAGCAVQQPPTLIPFDDGEYWVLGNDLVFPIRDTGQRIVVPRGFVTDFASVPRIFWTFFPKHGEYTRAAIVHDFLYWEQRCNREQADELFDIVMEDSDVDSTSRFTIYAAVRVWGSSAWEENAEARAKGYIRVIPEAYINFPVKTHWVDYREFLHQMVEDSERREMSYSKAVPGYCNALQEKDGERPAVVPEPDDEPEQIPSPQPALESGIGA